MSYKLCRALVPKEENSRFHEILVKIKGIGENRLHFIGPGLDLSVYELTLNEEELSIMKLSLHKAKFIWLMD